jgi:outer membrane protein assembly factor BamB
MAPTVRRVSLLLAGAGLLTLPLLVTVTRAQDRDPPRPPKPARPAPLREAPPFSAGFSLPTETDYPKRLEAVNDYLAHRSWENGMHLLQGFLDREDAFVALEQTGPDGKPVLTWSTLRAEADRMLAELPREGVDFYRLTYGPVAKDLLAEAKKKKDAALLALVAQRYLHTEAGGEALALLAGYDLDRARYPSAARSFRRLLRRPGADGLPPEVLFQAVLAFARAGQEEDRDSAWKLLEARAPGGVRFGGDSVPLAELKKQLDRQPAEKRGVEKDTLLYRGNAARSAPGRGFADLAEPRWQTPSVRHPEVATWVADAVKQHEQRQLPVVPGAVPVALGNTVVYETYHGLEACDLETGRLEWAYPCRRSLEALVADLDCDVHLEPWVANYAANAPGVLFENSVIGTLSCDGRRVFAVEDLPVPPFPKSYVGYVTQSGQGLKLGQTSFLTDAVYHSRLAAFDLETGKKLWEAGGRTDPLLSAGPKPSLDDGYFLGPPLPLGGKLYALVEKFQDLRLFCLEPDTGEVAWSQLLGTTKTRMLLEGGRRLHAIPLASAEGVLVCPTDAGAVVAVDVATHSLLWAFAYRDEPPAPPQVNPLPRGRVRPIIPQSPPNLTTQWKGCSPIVRDGKVVFTAPDDTGLYCLALNDGSLLWKAEGSDADLYVAGVTADAVVVVGRQECRAVSLDNGKPLWKVGTGLPSGYGIVADGLLYLPLRSAAGDATPQVCVVDLDKGEVRQRLAAPGKEVLGNLTVHGDHVLSQSVTGVTAFPVSSVDKETGRQGDRETSK